MSSLITVRNAAQRLSLSESKVYRMATGGELPAVYIGRSLRIPEGAVDALANPFQEASLPTKGEGK